jgi:Icc protein
MTASEPSMLVAQLSDVHVRPRGHLYKGVADSNRMLADAIAHLHALDRRPDRVVITGDLVDEGRVDEYAMAVELLDALEIPWLVMPGNHDDRSAFRAAFEGHAYLPREGPLHFSVDAFPLRFVALDACVPGRHHAEVDAAALDWLRTTLEADRRTPTLLLMHHPPFACGIPYLDAYRCHDTEGLEAVLRGVDNVEAVLCGHVHRAMARRWAGTIVCACPSTTTEIALRLAPAAAPASYLGPPACLLHLWTPGQGVVSHTSHIGTYPGPFPFF